MGLRFNVASYLHNTTKGKGSALSLLLGAKDGQLSWLEHTIKHDKLPVKRSDGKQPPLGSRTSKLSRPDSLAGAGCRNEAPICLHNCQSRCVPLVVFFPTWAGKNSLFLPGVKNDPAALSCYSDLTCASLDRDRDGKRKYFAERLPPWCHC